MHDRIECVGAGIQVASALLDDRQLQNIVLDRRERKCRKRAEARCKKGVYIIGREEMQKKV